jgi:hypothetical protein
MHNRAVVDRVWAAMESDDFEAFEDLIHPDGIDFRGIGTQITTAREMREFVEAYKAGFPDLRHEVVDSIESGRHDRARAEGDRHARRHTARPEWRDPGQRASGRVGVAGLREGPRRQGHVVARLQRPAGVPRPARGDARPCRRRGLAESARPRPLGECARRSSSGRPVERAGGHDRRVTGCRRASELVRSSGRKRREDLHDLRGRRPSGS